MNSSSLPTTRIVKGAGWNRNSPASSSRSQVEFQQSLHPAFGVPGYPRFGPNLPIIPLNTGSHCNISRAQGQRNSIYNQETATGGEMGPLTNRAFGFYRNSPVVQNTSENLTMNGSGSSARFHQPDFVWRNKNGYSV